MKRIWLLALALAVAGPAAAEQTEYRDARIRYLEPGVTLHRATEPDTEQAVANLPWLPGDRAWTDTSGRAELQFADGSLVHVATDSKLDYAGQDFDSGVAVLRLWTGSIYIVARGGQEGPAFEIETPDGVVSAREAGVYRVDVIPGETRVSVLRGHAGVDTGSGRVELYSGDRTYAAAGREPEPPHRYDHASADEFDAWSRARRDRNAGYTPPGLPVEIQPYTAELEQHGSWSVVADAGYVWRPRVSVGWQPYANGRWAWSPYGWTWVGYEPWGWAPYHYGRWGHSLGVGWYWIPGRSWSGAWVSWSIGGGYVGWCPLGRRGRPVYGPHRGGHRPPHHGSPRHAVPRGSLGAGSGDAWLYARASGLGARDLSVHRVERERVASARLAVLAEGQPPGRGGVRDGRFAGPRRTTARPARNLQDPRAVPTAARPGVGARPRAARDRGVSTAETQEGRRDRSLGAVRRGFDRNTERSASPAAQPAAPRSGRGATSGAGPRPRRERPDRAHGVSAPPARAGARDRSLAAVRRLLDRGDTGRGSTAARTGTARREVGAASRGASRPRHAGPDRRDAFATPSAGDGVRDRSLGAARRQRERAGRSRPTPSTRSTTTRPGRAASSGSRESARPGRSSGVSRSGSSSRRARPTSAARPGARPRSGGVSSPGGSARGGRPSDARSRGGATRGSKDRNRR